MGGFRSTFQNNLRTNAHKLLKEFTRIPPDDISRIKTATVRANSDEFKRLLGSDTPGWKVFPPILRGQDMEGELEEVMLRSNIIIRVCLLVLPLYLLR